MEYCRLSRSRACSIIGSSRMRIETRSFRSAKRNVRGVADVQNLHCGRALALVKIKVTVFGVFRFEFGVLRVAPDVAKCNEIARSQEGVRLKEVFNREPRRAR